MWLSYFGSLQVRLRFYTLAWIFFCLASTPSRINGCSGRTAQRLFPLSNVVIYSFILYSANSVSSELLTSKGKVSALKGSQSN